MTRRGQLVSATLQSTYGVPCMEVVPFAQNASSAEVVSVWRCFEEWIYVDCAPFICSLVDQILTCACIRTYFSYMFCTVATF